MAPQPDDDAATVRGHSLFASLAAPSPELFGPHRSVESATPPLTGSAPDTDVRTDEIRFETIPRAPRRSPATDAGVVPGETAQSTAAPGHTDPSYTDQSYTDPGFDDIPWPDASAPESPWSTPHHEAPVAPDQVTPAAAPLEQPPAAWPEGTPTSARPLAAFSAPAPHGLPEDHGAAPVPAPHHVPDAPTRDTPPVAQPEHAPSPPPTWAHVDAAERSAPPLDDTRNATPTPGSAEWPASDTVGVAPPVGVTGRLPAEPPWGADVGAPDARSTIPAPDEPEARLAAAPTDGDGNGGRGGSVDRRGGTTARVLGVLALVVGVLAVGAALVPLTSAWSWIPAVVAIVLGVIALVRRASPRLPAVAGTVLGPVALALAVLVSFTAILDALVGAGTVFAETTPTPEQTAVQPAETEPPVPADVVHGGEGTTTIAIEPLDGAGRPVVVRVSAAEPEVPIEVWSLGPAGQRLEKLVDTLGPYDGTVAFVPPPTEGPDGNAAPDEGSTSNTSLEILTEGAWTVTVRSIASLDSFDAQTSGTTDTVLRYDGPGGIATVGYTGTGGFTVRRHTDRTEVLLNTIGAYEGSVGWASGAALVIVRASGEWTITVA